MSIFPDPPRVNWGGLERLKRTLEGCEAPVPGGPWTLHTGAVHGRSAPLAHLSRALSALPTIMFSFPLFPAYPGVASRGHGSRRRWLSCRRAEGSEVVPWLRPLRTALRSEVLV